ncbi:MAG: NAD(P)-dependent alcohol dehydrogenase [Bacteroidota bacterium]
MKLKKDIIMINKNTQTMKAIVSTKYGSPDVLQFQEVAKPEPGDDEILVKIHATSVTRAHTMMRTGYPLIGRLVIGLTKPKNQIPGTDLAGVIESIGKNISDLQVGDEVFGSTDVNMGCYAEYVKVKKDDILIRKPKKMTFAEATAILDGSTTALPFLQSIAKVKKGQKILINGASGGIGTAAVQLAKFFGAHVTGVCGPSNQEMVKALGADEVIDYTKEDFTKSDATYDIIFDTVGKQSFKKCKPVLSVEGIYISPVLNVGLLMDMLFTSIFGKKKAMFAATGMLKTEEKLENIGFISSLINQEKLKVIIDRTFRLEDTADAHRYVDQGHKKGNVVVVM